MSNDKSGSVTTRIGVTAVALCTIALGMSIYIGSRISKAENPSVIRCQKASEQFRKTIPEHVAAFSQKMDQLQALSARKDYMIKHDLPWTSEAGAREFHQLSVETLALIQSLPSEPDMNPVFAACEVVNAR